MPLPGAQRTDAPYPPSLTGHKKQTKFVLPTDEDSSYKGRHTSLTQRTIMNMGTNINMSNYSPSTRGLNSPGRRIQATVKQLALLAFALIVTSSPLWAQPDKNYKGSPEFERMKALVGTWKGKADMGQGPMEMTVEYRIISGGSAIEERIFAGTPKEMVTMYHDKGGKLALTHYCMLRNQPAMRLKSSDKKTLKF